MDDPLGMLASGAVYVTLIPESTASAAFRCSGRSAFTGALANGQALAIAAHAPVAGADRAVTAQEVAVEIDVLGNDSDVDLDPLSVASVSTPSAGNASTLGADVTYTPPAGFDGVADFSYTVADGHGGFATGVVEVLTVGRVPAALQPVSGTMELHVDAVPGWHYTVEYKDDLLAGEAWQELDGGVAPSGPMLIVDPTPPLQRFYRFKVRP